MHVSKMNYNRISRGKAPVIDLSAGIDVPGATTYEAVRREGPVLLNLSVSKEAIANGSVAPSQPAGGHAADRSDFLPIDIGYRLLKLIGRGGYGNVYSAESKAGGFPAAVKIMFRPSDHADTQRELRSLQTMQQVRHAYLLATYGYWQLDDRLIIAMERADSTLKRRLEECKAQGLSGIPVDELLDYFREAAEAIDHLHNQGVCHRDIKPANILTFGGHVKVCDFGLARWQVEKLKSATSCGTPYYMAPEIWDGKLEPTSDQYSLAVTYVELRTGKIPFDAGSIGELIRLHLQCEPDLGSLGAAEKAVLLRALAKQPEDRFPSCVEFVRALAQAALTP